mgnify:CR=1 FL=1
MHGDKLPWHPELIATNRKQVRSLFFKTDEDVDLRTFNQVFDNALALDEQWK